jgi:lycopene cyclase domain-containing protein
MFFFTIGVIWDSYAIINGHWLFPPEKTMGINIGVMPVEEYLFILILPFWIITTYKLVHEKLKLR